MIDLTEEQWEALFVKVDETVTKAMDELPESTRKKAEEVGCVVDKYTNRPNWHILGCYMAWTNGPIVIYAGQIFEDCHQDMDGAMQSVRQVYLHELAHAVGDLAEHEVKERGL
jgi:predicted Zn-dependent protease with MMP-like domain